MKLYHVFVTVLLGAVSCLPVFGASGDTGDPFQSVVKPNGDRMDRSWKRYRNANLGYCVSYPSRWSRGIAFDGSGLFVQSGTTHSAKPSGEIDIGPIMPEKSEAPADARTKPVETTLAEDLQEHLVGLQKFARAERLEILDQHTMDVQGTKALFVKNQYYDPLERTNWMEEVVFLKHKGELYRVELQCPPSQIKRFEPVFAYLVNTIEFDCK
jgi:hypothetical protein